MGSYPFNSTRTPEARREIENNILRGLYGTPMPTIQDDQANVTLKFGHPAIPDLSVSGDKSTTLWISLAVVLVIMAILVYMVVAKKAKAKARTNIPIQMNPSFQQG